MIWFWLVWLLTGIVAARFIWCTSRKWQIEALGAPFLGRWVASTILDLFIGPIGLIATMLAFERKYWSLTYKEPNASTSK